MISRVIPFVTATAEVQKFGVTSTRILGISLEVLSAHYSEKLNYIDREQYNCFILN
jgi:hypothetical protein